MKNQNKNQNLDSVLDAEQVCKEPLQKSICTPAQVINDLDFFDPGVINLKHSWRELSRICMLNLSDDEQDFKGWIFSIEIFLEEVNADGANFADYERAALDLWRVDHLKNLQSRFYMLLRIWILTENIEFSELKRRKNILNDLDELRSCLSRLKRYYKSHPQYSAQYHG